MVQLANFFYMATPLCVLLIICITSPLILGSELKRVVGMAAAECKLLEAEIVLR